MMELHKGHGPALFKTYQKLVALTLFFVIFGGVMVGLLAKAYRRKTVIALVFGAIVFAVWLYLPDIVLDGLPQTNIGGAPQECLLRSVIIGDSLVASVLLFPIQGRGIIMSNNGPSDHLGEPRR